ncbi:type II secretion system protein GspG [Opitutaceae bacterium EW11]|nr:type II secretion system protein GspG [Opitutaceae bacterium EW11]
MLALFGVTEPIPNDRSDPAQIFIRQTAKHSLDQFRLRIGRYPTTKEGLSALAERPSEIVRNWGGPYILGPLPLDPWGRPYHYRCPGIHNINTYDLWSLGPDGELSSDDIANWQR